MSRLNNMYQSAKRNAGKIVAIAVIVGALAGIKGYIDRIGEEIYRGNIKGQKVVYEEGRFNTFETPRHFITNKMTVSNGETTYVLFDEKDETPISWKQETAPEYNTDKLEKVVIKTSSETREYDIDDINTETLNGRHAGVVFYEANAMYNNLRTQIRKQLRSDYQKLLTSIEETLK